MSKTNSYCIFDFETGGFNAIPVKTEKGEVKEPGNPFTELALLSINGDTLEEIDRTSFLFKPYDPTLVYSPQALEVTGITMDLLEKEGKTLAECKELFIEHMEKSNIQKHVKYRTIMVGHNPLFDNDFLKEFARRTKIDLSRYCFGKVDSNKNYHIHYEDTQILAGRMAYGHDENLINHKLGTVVAHMGLDLNNAHRALQDVIATKDILVDLIKRMRSQGGSMTDNARYRYRTQFNF